MHCNFRPPEPRQTFPALITTPCQVRSRWTYPLHSIHSVFAVDTFLCTVTSTFDRATFTSDIWPWTLAVYRLWRDETLYEIWSQWSNPWRSYCDFSVWPYDLEHSITHCAPFWNDFHNFHIIRAWIIAFLTLIRYVTLRSWPLTSWPWKFAVHQRDQSLYEIWANRAIRGRVLLHTLCHAVTLTFDLWPLDLEFYSTLGVMRLNSVQNLREIELLTI